MARKVSVEIVADASKLHREFQRAASTTRTFEKQVESTRGHLRNLHASLLGAAAGLIGGAGLVGALKASVSAAEDQQTAMVELRKQAQNLGFSWKKYGGEINEALRRQRELTGFTREETQAAFGNLLRATHSVSEALKDNSLAADIARAKHMDLQAASLLVVKAQMGMTGLLRRQGIDIKPVTAAMDALTSSHKSFTAEQKRAAKALDQAATGQKAVATLQQQFGGVAEKYGKTAAGAQERLRVAVQETEAEIGKVLLPTVTRIASHVATWLNKTENQRKIQHAANEVIKTTSAVLKGLIPFVHGAWEAAQKFAKAVGGWDNAAKIILSGVLAAKALKVAAAIRAIGRASAIASEQAGAAGLFGWLTKLRALGPIAIPVAIVAAGAIALSKSKAWSKRAPGGQMVSFDPGQGFSVGGPRGGRKKITLADAARILGVSVASLGGDTADPHDTNLSIAQKIVADHAKARRRAATKAAQTAADIVRAGKTRGTGPGPADMPDALRLRIAEAAATKTTKDDIAALREWLRLLEQRKKAAKSVAARADIQEEINRTHEGLAGFKPGKPKAVPVLSDALREGIARAGMTAGTGDDLKAYGNALAGLRAELAKTKDTARRAAIETEINKITHAVAGINATAAKAKLAKVRDAFKTAWAGLAGTATTAFDKATRAGLDTLSRNLQTNLKQVDATLKGALEAADAFRQQLTPAEQALQDRAAAKAAAELAQRITDAQQALGDAKQQEGESDADYAKRKLGLQKDLADALYDQQTAGLEKQAVAERTARDKQADLMVTAAQDIADKQKQAAQDAYDAQSQAYQDERDLLKKHLDQELALQLKYWLARGELAKKARADLIAFINAHPEFGLTPADIGLPATVTTGGGVGVGGRIPAMAAGGTVRRGGLALVGEQGPELRYLPGGSSVVPLGGRPVTVHIEHADMLSPAAVELLTAHVVQRLAYR